MFTGDSDASKAAKNRNETSKSGASGDSDARRKSGMLAPSILSADLTIRGEVETDGDLHIDGRIEGDVHSRRVTVGKDGIVNGAIVGDDVTIRGQVKGGVQARSVTLTKTARVEATIEHDLLSVEPGAELLGRTLRRGSQAAQAAEKAPEPKADQPTTNPTTTGPTTTTGPVAGQATLGATAAATSTSGNGSGTSAAASASNAPDPGPMPLEDPIGKTLEHQEAALSSGASAGGPTSAGTGESQSGNGGIRFKSLGEPGATPYS